MNWPVVGSTVRVGEKGIGTEASGSPRVVDWKSWLKKRPVALVLEPLHCGVPSPGTETSLLVASVHRLKSRAASVTGAVLRYPTYATAFPLPSAKLPPRIRVTSLVAPSHTELGEVP